MAQDYLGIDVSKAKVDVFLLREDRVKGRVFANSPTGFAQMQRWLSQQKTRDLHACMEATGTYWEAIAAFLFNTGYTVSVVNPACISAFSKSQLRRTKTDQVDAKVIAEFTRAMSPEPWSPPPAHIHELKGLVRRLESLQDMRLQETNRLASPGISEPVTLSINAVIDALNSQIKAIKEQIKDHIDNHPDLKNQRDLLISIPGIADTTAAALLSEINIQAFSSARQLAAQAGLTPRHRQSGSSIHGRSSLSKTGNARIRRALFLPAVVAKQCNPIIKSFYDRLILSGKAKMVAVAAAMRKLLHIVFGVLKSGQAFNPSISAPNA